MRKAAVWILIAALLLAGCAADDVPQGQSVTFYYLDRNPSMGTGSLIFASEQRQIDEEGTLAERVQEYLTGPQNQNLRNPFPEKLRVTSASIQAENQTLLLTLSSEYDKLTGQKLTMANACLTWTLTEYFGVDSIILRSESGENVMDGMQRLRREQYMTAAATVETEHTVHIYFADRDNRYLLPATRKVVAVENNSLGTYVVHQLLEGPIKGNEDDMYPVIPDGTRLLDFTLDEGTATVNLSSEFVQNRPRTELGERMTLYALVNSLTELDSIDRVRIEVEGNKLNYYQYMVLSAPMERSEAVIGPVRTGINEFDATLYYQSWNEEYLASCPTRIIRDDTKTMDEQIIRTLLDGDPPNGLHNVIPKGTQLLSVETIEGVCHVDLSEEFADIMEGYSAERMAVNALVASLCSIDSIHSVVLTIEGGTVSMPHYELDREIFPMYNWFFPY